MKLIARLRLGLRRLAAVRPAVLVRRLQSFAATLHKPDIEYRFLEGGVKLVVAGLLATGAWSYAMRQTAAQDDAVRAQRATPHQELFKPLNLEKAIVGMKETNDLLVSWSLLILGGTVGITILAKGARIRDRNWAMTLIPAVWLLLWQSLSNGADFKRRLTFQIAQEKYDFLALNVHLYLQMHFFLASLVVLGGLAGMYLLFRFSLLEEKKGDSQ